MKITLQIVKMIIFFNIFINLSIEKNIIQKKTTKCESKF